MHEDIDKILFTEDDLRARVSEMGHQITATLRYHSKWITWLFRRMAME